VRNGSCAQSLQISKWREACKTLIGRTVSTQLNILLVRPWTHDSERLRTSLRAIGLSVCLTRVDFPASLYAALSWGSFDVILFDPKTPSISHELLANALRDAKLTTPIIVLSGDDVGKVVAAQVVARRN